MSSFLCFLCHSTVNSDTNEDIREKYRDVVGMHLCLDSHLCHICCHVLHKLWLFRAVCLKRSLEYPVLFSERGTLNLQRNDLEVHSVCADESCGQFLNSYVNAKVVRVSHEDGATHRHQQEDNEYVRLTRDDKADVDEYFRKDDVLPNKENILETNAESFNEFLNYSPDKNKDKNEEIFNNFNDVNQNHTDIYADNAADNYMETDNEDENNVSIDEVLTGKDEFIAGDIINRDMLRKPAPEVPKKPRMRRPKKNRRRGFDKIMLTIEEQKAELDQRRKEKKYLDAEFKCHSCALSFLFKDSYQTHMMRHEESNGEHQCALCGLRFASPAVLRAHAAHHGERHACRACLLRVPPRARRTHARRCLAAPADRVACHLCGGLFQDHEGLTQHLRRQHAAGCRALPCGVCGHSCRNQAALRTHMLTHINKKFECGSCPSVFSNPYTRAQHVKNKHQARASELHRCEPCNVAYTSRKSLLAHKRNSLNHQQTFHECGVCGRGCATARALAAHVEAHAGRAHACAHCPRRYATRKSLLRHARAHAAPPAPPQPADAVCHLCAKRFKGTNKLNRHLREVCEKQKMEEQLRELLDQP